MKRTVRGPARAAMLERGRAARELAVQHGDVTRDQIARATPEELVAGARVASPPSERALLQAPREGAARPAEALRESLGIAPWRYKVLAGVREVGRTTLDAVDEPAPPTADPRWNMPTREGLAALDGARQADETTPPEDPPPPSTDDRNVRRREERAARGLLQAPREGAGRPAEAGARRDDGIRVPVTAGEKAALVELAGGRGHVADLLRRAPARLERWREVARLLADAAADAGVGPEDPALAEYAALETEEVG